MRAVSRPSPWSRGLVPILAAVACRPEALLGEPERERAGAGEVEAGPRAQGPAPDPGVPGLVVRNPEGVGIEIYAAYIVDRRGELGTRVLWPHASDCPGVEPPPRLVGGGGGTRWLPPPLAAYVPGQCEPAPLPPGDYVLRLDSGYGQELYAVAAMTLPLTAPVELVIERHEHGPPCDPELARRAAVLTFAMLEAAGALPAGLRDECDVNGAVCGTLPVAEGLPPPACTITLRERLLEVSRAAGSDAPRWVTAWADPEVVVVSRPDVSRTSASRLDLEGQPVVVAGRASHSLHEHGGDAAEIASATFDASNPLSRPLALRVRDIEFLTDHGCGPPQDVRAHPRLIALSHETLVPGATELTVTFERQPAYQSHCDRFATRVTFLVDGRPVAATVEHHVSRIEPLRER